MNPTTVTTDTFATIPEYADLRAAVEGRSWPRFEAALQQLPADQAGAAIYYLAEVDGIESFLESGTSTMARTALAWRYIVVGWQARGRDQAENTTGEQFMGFFEWLGKAEALLQAILDEDAGFAPTWKASLLTARGLQLGTPELRRRYQHFAALSPRDLNGQSQVLQFILPKWFGSVEEATAFVGSPGTHPALVALLQIEMWSHLQSKAGLAHVKKATPALKAASAEFATFAGTDAVSVQAHNYFAMAFWLGGNYSEAAVHLAQAGWRTSEFPWRYAVADDTHMQQIQEYVARKGKKALAGLGT